MAEEPDRQKSKVGSKKKRKTEADEATPKKHKKQKSETVATSQIPMRISRVPLPTESITSSRSATNELRASATPVPSHPTQLKVSPVPLPSEVKRTPVPLPTSTKKASVTLPSRSQNDGEATPSQKKDSNKEKRQTKERAKDKDTETPKAKKRKTKNVKVVPETVIESEKSSSLPEIAMTDAPSLSEEIMQTKAKGGPRMFDPNTELEGMLRLPSDASDNSAFKLISTTMYLPVPAIATGYPFEAAVAHSLSSSLFEYHPPVKGIIVSYQNTKITHPPKQREKSLAQVTDGYSDSFLWVSADLLVFRPNNGAWLTGQVSLQTETHIALIVKGIWNASVARKRLPKSWRWVPDADDASSLGGDDGESDLLNIRLGGAGLWNDGNGNAVGGMVVFRARDFDLTKDRDEGRTVLSIEGTMLNEEDDKEADKINELSAPRSTSRFLGQRKQAPARTTPTEATARPEAQTGAERMSATAETPVVSSRKKGKQKAN